MKIIMRGSIYLVLLLSLFACGQSNTDNTASINHIVLVWLKADTSIAEINTIIEESKALKSIGGIQSLNIGTAIASERKIVDDSFSLGLHMRFANLKDMNHYLKHPRHVDFVDNFIKPKLEKILVYDF